MMAESSFRVLFQFQNGKITPSTVWFHDTIQKKQKTCASGVSTGLFSFIILTCTYYKSGRRDLTASLHQKFASGVLYIVG